VSAAAAVSEDFASLSPGDPAPRVHQRSTTNPRYHLDTAAGRYIVLCFFASAADPAGRAALEAVQQHRSLFDGQRACFFGVSLDPADEKHARVRESMPGLRYFWDFDGAISRRFGVIAREAKGALDLSMIRRCWVILDPTLRVRAVFPFAADGSDRSDALQYIERLPDPARHAGLELQAPVLFLPNVFEAELCRKLIELYEWNGGTESGFMREADGKTVQVFDPRHKRRKDYSIEDPALIQELQARIKRRIAPEIRKVHQFDATRMERYIVSCYAAEDHAHFRAHRDNTTKGTAHRRFAVSINLNSEFEGGEVSFPEYGPRSFKPPPGGAVVFSCSLLHEVSEVTAGRRYAFLPFLYDDAAAKLREQNNQYLTEGALKYKDGAAG
jgi:peroxiredoxin/predicted 2-oxoglutarate/Fe(II)-dependent dioxygenase YbiX